ncbi:MAG TPA: hypothetical protein VMT44_04975 [Methanoregula sp.]|nr:hypothetical protein [Methanoregula sp.]
MQTWNGSGWNRWLLPVILAGACILAFPVPAGASTPPLQPVLGLGTPDTLPPGSDLPITVHWDRDYSYWVRPGTVTVTLYAVPEGTPCSAWTLRRVAGPGTPGQDTADYSVTVPDRELPSGKFMLIASDPFSGAVVRRPVELHGSAAAAAGVPAVRPEDTLSLPGIDTEIFS